MINPSTTSVIIVPTIDLEIASALDIHSAKTPGKNLSADVARGDESRGCKKESKSYAVGRMHKKIFLLLLDRGLGFLRSAFFTDSKGQRLKQVSCAVFDFNAPRPCLSRENPFRAIRPERR
jgi:hypothetical protein